MFVVMFNEMYVDTSGGLSEDLADALILPLNVAHAVADKWNIVPHTGSYVIKEIIGEL